MGPRVSDLLGHSGIEVTANVYARVLAPLKDEAAEAMNRALTSCGEGPTRSVSRTAWVRPAGYRVLVAYSSGDAVTPPEVSELTDSLLAQASSQADELVDTFNTDHRSTEFEPELTWILTVGASGEPIFRFSLVLALEGDLDPADFPSDQIADLMAEARRRIRASLVDQSDWFVLLNARDTVEA